MSGNNRNFTLKFFPQEQMFVPFPKDFVCFQTALVFDGYAHPTIFNYNCTKGGQYSIIFDIRNHKRLYTGQFPKVGFGRIG